MPLPGALLNWTLNNGRGKAIELQYQREISTASFLQVWISRKVRLRIVRKSRIARRKISIIKKVVIVRMSMIAEGGLSSIKVFKYE